MKKKIEGFLELWLIACMVGLIGYVVALPVFTLMFGIQIWLFGHLGLGPYQNVRETWNTLMYHRAALNYVSIFVGVWGCIISLFQEISDKKAMRMRRERSCATPEE
ncbi:MAG TPA: hypothetical protein VKT99_04380 [Xanthobacteraceae bacterium]|nr:hypothetical protein [Xanthobacteraceae bacterium]